MYIPDKKQFWPFFPRVSKKTDLKQHFLSFRRFYSNHWSSYKTISVAPTRLLKTQAKRLLKAQFLEKNAKIATKELFWPVFPRIIDYEKPQGTKYKGPLRTLSNFFQFIGTII